MGRFFEKWNKNRFSIYDSEEKTVLKLIQNIYNFLSNFASELDNKTDLNGNHNGSWQGVTKPSQSQEGMATMVDSLWSMAYVNVKDYGAKGDGITNDYDSIYKALIYAIENKKTLYFPNGKYAVNNNFEISPDYKNELISILGESHLGVEFVKLTGNKIDYVFDFKNCNKVYAKNLSSFDMGFNVFDNSKYAEGDKAWALALREKDFYLENLIYRGEGGHTSYYKYINSPCPKNYNRYSDGNYAKYPLEITNGSGYNAININNFATNSDGSIGQPADNSAIGIVDRVINSAGVLFVDMNGRRSFMKLNRGEAEIKSKVMEGTVFEIHHNGHIAIGCSTDESELGYGAIKVRDNSPRMELFDYNNNDIKGSVGMVKTSNGEQIYLKVKDTGIVVTLNNDNSSEMSGFRYTPIVGGLQVRATVGQEGTTGLLLNNNNGNVRSLMVDSNNRIRMMEANETNINNGQILLPVMGNISSYRPSLTNTTRDRGFMYFDTTLNKPIWWNGTKWVDSNGTSV